MNDKWQLSFGTFPGILFGARSYVEKTRTNHVLYIGFIDVCLTTYSN